jgi:hypothetical protein
LNQLLIGRTIHRRGGESNFQRVAVDADDLAFRGTRLNVN